MGKLMDVDSRFISLLMTKMPMKNTYSIDIETSEDRDCIITMWNHRFIEITDVLRKYFQTPIIEYYDSLEKETRESKFPFPLIPEFKKIYIYDSSALKNTVFHDYSQCLTIIIDLIVTSKHLVMNRISHRFWIKNGFIPRSYRKYFIEINHLWNKSNIKTFFSDKVLQKIFRNMRIYKRFLLFHFILKNVSMSFNGEIKNLDSFRKLMFVNFFRVYKERPWHLPRSDFNKFLTKKSNKTKYNVKYANQLFISKVYDGKSSTVNILLSPFTGEKVDFHEWMCVTYAFITGRLYAKEGDDEIIDYLNGGDFCADGILFQF
jgi:hypothetical protein